MNVKLKRVYNIQGQDECGEIWYVRYTLSTAFTVSTYRSQNGRLLKTERYFFTKAIFLFLLR